MSIQSITDRWRSFLYRRLAKGITCEVRLPGNHPLALDNKYQVNSLQDVFCHPFYWQLFGWLDRAPQLVVDLGAHCGHFSMLADVCFDIQFGAQKSTIEYLMIEPNPKLIPVIRRNLLKSGLCPRHVLKQGLVGQRTGTGVLWVSPSNYLSASLQPDATRRSVSADYLDLEQLVDNRPVDLLKIDIEGAEYDLVANYPKVLAQVQKLMIEIHSTSEANRNKLDASLDQAGLRKIGRTVDHGEFQLAMFQRV